MSIRKPPKSGVLLPKRGYIFKLFLSFQETLINAVKWWGYRLTKKE